MPQTLMLIPVGMGVGLTTVSEGLARSFESQGIKTTLIHPISYLPSKKEELQENDFLTSFEKPLPIEYVEHLFSENRQDELLEFIIAHHNLAAKDTDMAILQGMVSTQLRAYSTLVNPSIARAIDAQVIFVAAPGNKTASVLEDQIKIVAQAYGGISHPRILGCMINKVGAPTDQYGNSRLDLFDLREEKEASRARYEEMCPIFKTKNFKLLASFPWKRSLMSPRVKDICHFLRAEVISAGKMEEKRALHFVMAGATVENMSHLLTSNVMIITPFDRCDVIIATCLAFVNGVPIAALLLTGGSKLYPNTEALCKRAIELGLPILSVATDSLRTAITLQGLNTEIPPDDTYRLDKVREYMASFIDSKWIQELSSKQTKRYLSPAAFRFQLTETARLTLKKIALPEGEDPRIIKAAQMILSKKIASVVLLGDRDRIDQIAKNHGTYLPKDVEVIAPAKIATKYIKPLVKLRQNKITEKEASDLLQDPLIVSLMLLSDRAVDGVVAGVHYTTAQTLRPAFKLIKADGLVSSFFFMCLPNQVVLYADCAVNPNPSAEQLATIAIQTAESARKFSILPRIALISYSTGSSGKGADVLKVESAVKEIKKRRPDLIVDGPLQYDAAFSREVARKKAPKSPVAGEATVYIFPDLNTANTTYKAVQRSANVLSIGPVLQGLSQPVNDLSRGASVEDIVYTVAITAIQAG